ncbi:MAG TPA: DUF3667 domain-containing protein [Cyclobacteriaceae bacterium]|nr:DUF3667 domain-containing protein [Cyclobacteriaceae bacterium]
MNEDTQRICQNCGQQATGAYCASCGEKSFDPSQEFRLTHFLRQVYDEFIAIDSKLLKTIGTLLAKPGKLTQESMHGVRIKYLKPIQLFLLVSVAFYFFLPGSDAYYSNLNEMNKGYVQGNYLENTFHYNVISALESRSGRTGLTVTQLIANFEISAAEKAKGFLFLIIPFLGLQIWLLFSQSVKFYVVHVMLALHALSFFLLLNLGFVLLLRGIGVKDFSGIVFLPVGMIFAGYLYLSFKRIFGSSGVRLMINTVITTCTFVLLLLVYRQLVTITTIVLL